MDAKTSESAKREIVWEALVFAKTVIDKLYSHGITEWDDEDMKRYFYEINEFCCEITEKEEKENGR